MLAKVEVGEHLEALRAEGPRLAVAAERAGLDAPVPTCPEWVVRDLVRHQGGVHRWATGVVATPRTEPWDVGLDEVVGEWPSDGALIDWFLQGHAALVDALAGAPPDLQCWTFLGAPSPRAMWARRQAHETTIHRVDAELSAGGQLSPISAVLASDGIDELLLRFITRGRRLRADPPRTLGVRCTDVEGSWLVGMTPGGVECTPGWADGGADCEVTGPASALYLALWSRASVDALTISGDRQVIDHFLDVVHVRWS